ncbi:MAG: response regulator transcription factor [Flammeovirgaceae bacterium]
MTMKLGLSAALLLYSTFAFCHYQISGYIHSGGERKIIFLSLLKHHESATIYPAQVISKVTTDRSGFFRFTGDELPEKNKFYRIHTNFHEGSSGLEIYTDGKKRNYHNFIFSNNDTLFFPSNESVWFSSAKNTNAAHVAYENLLSFIADRQKEINNITNAEILMTAKRKSFEKLKSYVTDSIQSPLVKLLAFRYLNIEAARIQNDFKEDPEFYYDIKDALNSDYNGKSYYLEFEQEFYKLSYHSLYAQLNTAKRINFYLLLAVGILMILLILSLFKIYAKNSSKRIENQLLNLTAQEKKVAVLILKGETNKSIASTLFISLSTVKSHVNSLYAKLNVTNRQEFKDKYQNQPWD